MLRKQNRRQAKHDPNDLGRVRGRRARVRRRAGASVAALVVFSLVLVSGAFAASALTIRLHRASDLQAASPIGPATDAVIFVVDGLSPADLSSVPTPNIDDLTQRGVTYRNAWVGQLQSVGPASNATIATGVIPAMHGIVGLQWRTVTGPVQRPTAPQQVQLGALDQAMRTKNTTPVAVRLKNHYSGARVLSAGGAGCANADAAGSWLADYVICPVRQGRNWVASAVTGHSLPAQMSSVKSLTVPVQKAAPGVAAGWRTGQEDHWLTRYTILAMRRTHPALTVVNFPELETAALVASPGRRQAVVRTLVAGLDKDVGSIVAEVKREKIANRTVFVLTSDAAMADLSQRIPASMLQRAILAAGGQRAYMQPGEATFLGLGNNLQAEPVSQTLQDEHLRGIDAVYYKTQSGNVWQYQPQYLDPDLSASFASAVNFELGTLASATSPDVVVVGSPGTGVVPATNRGADTWTQLGLQWDTQHIPLVLAGHGVVPDGVSDYPARLVDVAPTISALMGLNDAPTDGVILADGLEQPGSRARRSQEAERKREQPLVAALKSRFAGSGR